jgi:hypothetical protein
MTDICREFIRSADAWKGRDIGGKEGLLKHLTVAELCAFEAVLAATHSIPTQQLTKADFVHPQLSPLFASVREELMEGRGAVVVSGVALDRFSVDELARIYWAFGVHLGKPRKQTADGNRFYDVKREADNPHMRGVRGDGELTLHTDTPELMGLACIERAESGGDSILVSSLAVHNTLLEENPESLEPLYEGFYYGVSEIEPGMPTVSDMKIPVFCYRHGKVSSTIALRFMRSAAERLNVEIPEILLNAMSRHSNIANRPEMKAQFMLEPGEMALWNNFTQLHARTQFSDSESRRRYLLRLHIDVPDEPRPVSKDFLGRATVYSGRLLTD